VQMDARESGQTLFALAYGGWCRGWFYASTRG